MKALKTFALLTVMMLLFATSVALPQATTSNTLTSGYQKDGQGNVIGYYVNVSFEADSTLSQWTPVFQIPEFDGVDWVTDVPITFRLKAVGTYGTPNRSIYLLGCFNSATDTLALDSLSNADTKQTESDTTGVLTLNGKRAPLGYRLFIRDITADINTGYINLFWPKSEAQIKQGR